MGKFLGLMLVVVANLCLASGDIVGIWQLERSRCENGRFLGTYFDECTYEYTKNGRYINHCFAAESKYEISGNLLVILHPNNKLEYSFKIDGNRLVLESPHSAAVCFGQKQLDIYRKVSHPNYWP